MAMAMAIFTVCTSCQQIFY